MTVLMSATSIGLDPTVCAYLLDHSGEPAELNHLRHETAGLPEADMQISPEQGRFMGWLVGLLGARRCLEVGVFTGYSSLAVALALPPGGTLVACDLSAKWTRIAQRYWERAGVAERIDLRLGNAMDTLDGLIQCGAAGSFDFAFVDADKSAYEGYYERCLALLRRGGVMAFDNALWGGQVADSNTADSATVAIRRVNQRAREDARVSASLVPIGDGLLLMRKL